MAHNPGPSRGRDHPVMAAAVMVLSACGLMASLALVQAELAILTDPSAELACDLNPLIGCSTSILSPQAHILGISNSIFGVAAFAALFVLGVVLACGGRLPRLVWWGLSAGALAGLGIVSYFLYHSAFTFYALCPFCLVVWGATLGVVPLLLGGAGAEGAFGRSAVHAGRRALRYSWAIVLLLYLLVVLFIVVTMSDKIGYLFPG